MKYFTASLLVAGVAAQSFDAATAVNDLITASNKLTSDVNAYTGGDGATLKADAASLVQLITSDDTSVKSAAELTTDQALALAGPVQSLGTAAKAAVDALVGKKSLFVQNGQGAAVYEALQKQAEASNQFSTDLTSKVPEGLRGIAANLAAPISSALASGVSAYADAATASGGSSATATAASSAAAATTTAAIVTMSSNGSAPTSAPSPTIVMGGANPQAVAGSAVGLLAFFVALGL